MTNRLSQARVRVLAAGGVTAAALAVSAAGVTSASAATPATSCTGISFTVLHNDRSGGVILPAGRYTVSSPNLGCKTASGLFTKFLNHYNGPIPRWKGTAAAAGWGTYTKNNSGTRFSVKRTSATGAGVAACPTSALKMSLGRPNATAGTTFYPLKFVNKGKTTCTLRGSPGVSAVTRTGAQIGNPAQRIHASFRTFTLAPGKQESATLGIISTGNYRSSRCKPVTAAGLKVFAPNARTAVTLKHSFSTCSSKTTSSLEVGAFGEGVDANLPQQTHAPADVTGHGTDEDPYTAPCDDPSQVVCTVSAFPPAVLGGQFWFTEPIHAYQCPADHPYLYDHSYQPAGTIIGLGVEITNLGAVGAHIDDWSSTDNPPDGLINTGTRTEGASVTNWTDKEQEWKLILHCTSDRKQAWTE